MGGAKDLLSMVHLPAAVEAEFEALVDESIAGMYFGPSEPRRGPVDSDRAGWLLRGMWDGLLTDDAIAGALARFLDQYSSAGGQEIRPTDSSAYDICRRGPRNVVDELAWFALGDGVLGVLVRDRTDDDYGGVVMTPDDAGRFRAVDCFHSLPTPDAAAPRLHAAMRTAAALKLRPDPL
jgi:hypothetical protein